MAAQETRIHSRHAAGAIARAFAGVRAAFPDPARVAGAERVRLGSSPS